jgi:hypothetical protein
MMVEMNIPLVLDVIRTTGIIVGIIYYLSILRNQQTTTRREQMYLRFQVANMDYVKAYSYLMSIDFTNLEEFLEHFDRKKNPEAWASYIFVGTRYHNIGLLLKEGLIDPELVFEIFNPMVIIQLWEKILPIEKETRRRNNHPKHYDAFEYLYEEAKKRYPDITPTNP